MFWRHTHPLLRLPRNPCSTPHPSISLPFSPFNFSLACSVMSCFYCKSILLIWPAPMGLARPINTPRLLGRVRSGRYPPPNTSTHPPPPCGVNPPQCPHTSRHSITSHHSQLEGEIDRSLLHKAPVLKLIGCLLVKCTMGVIVNEAQKSEIS